MALQNVRHFGTEGRRGDEEIPPSMHIFEFIVFRAADIKHLEVLENVPPPVPPMHDPAIVSMPQQGYRPGINP
eukprot:CAMPEP_0198342848 /NCGR_PEP_ID=MMETSP1450-20131203/55762_1 /TAXON_ID=753684 ORGANISM="Madagascaria erythrocladiodes, Strain CCMP3234" /NCGR_SAMPLE_ID=MMETSP1450 /ASSEMBLY_ACC=CAM_ASM_001115 /LENGTH=72 /DNA_ID=CAMNT_0044047971 /DNA_START=46 /DNA_END=260 /DNA_ORIENTATION=+